MTLSPTPGYLAQCTLTKKLAGRVAQLLRWKNILLPVFAILLFQLFTILGLFVRTLFVTDHSFRLNLYAIISIHSSDGTILEVERSK